MEERKKFLDQSIQAFFRVGEEKEKQTFITVYIVIKAPKIKKNTNFHQCIHGKVPKTQKNTNCHHFVNEKLLEQKKQKVFHFVHSKAP